MAIQSGIMAEVTKPNLRASVIDLALEIVSQSSTSNGINAIEIGCMFKNNEGFSTYRIARFVKDSGKQHRFISIEYNPEHVDAAKLMLLEIDPNSLSGVDFLCGHSLSMLPKAFEQMPSLDVALLDGGTHPEVCLQEFEMVLERLSRNGLIIIDDLQQIGPSPAYPVPRPFGKGTLIIPYLAIAEYLKVRGHYRDRNNQFSAESEGIPDSQLLKHTASERLLELLGPWDYRIIAKGTHKMLMVGNRSTLQVFERNMRIKKEFGSAEISPASEIVNTFENGNTSGNMGNVDTRVEIPQVSISASHSVASYCPETCIVFVSYGRQDVAARSYESLSRAVASCRDRVKLIISDATDDDQKIAWARNTDADEVILTPRFTPAATSRNLATTLVLDKYSPRYLCMVEDDFEYSTEWYPSIVDATNRLYGAMSPMNLAYGIFSACDHHVPAQCCAVDEQNNVTAYIFGAVAYQRFMPTSHYLSVMRYWDSDLLGISWAQTGGQTFRNAMRGFCGAVLPGGLSRPIDVNKSLTTWVGKRDPGPPAHSFNLDDYDVVRQTAQQAGVYLRSEK